MTRKSIVIVLIWLVVSVFAGYSATGEDAPKNIIWKKDNAKMVLIPAGRFEMGDFKNDPEEWMKRSRPVHTVELDAFQRQSNDTDTHEGHPFYRDLHDVSLLSKFNAHAGLDQEYARKSKPTAN